MRQDEDGTSGYARAGGRDIFYRSMGEGVPVIAIHGFGLDHQIELGSQEPIFQGREGYRRIYFDLPGMGRTGGALPRDSDEMLGLVQEFIDSVIPGERFLLTGASYGAYLARGVAFRWPERVRGLMLCVPVIIAGRERRALPLRKVIKEDVSFLRTLAIDDRNEFSSAATVLDEKVWERYRRDVMLTVRSADQKALLRFQETGYAFSFDVDRPPKPFPAPALMLMGRQDATVGYEDALRIIFNFPRGTVAVLDRASHALEMEQPSLFEALMGEWLDRVEEWSAGH
jgi:pimeloyl-ACP methyl ester carboxylesterase